MYIPFNKPYIPTGTLLNIARATMAGSISGNGRFTKKCHRFFEEKLKVPKVLLTSSCTDALEMTALLCNLQPGDEVIMPSFTFVSTPNAFLLRGARVVFADTLPDIPNADPAEVEKLISPKTRAIVVVHYGGVACDMDRFTALAKKYNLFLVEDAAHAIDSFYRGQPLGTLGDFGTYSFHETKNIIAGEGGLLIIRDGKNAERAEIIWEKGTNRAAFYRGEVDKYGWVDVGSSYLPADTIAAFLNSQMKAFRRIQNRRKKIWNSYHEKLTDLEKLGHFRLPLVPEYATVNGNLFFLVVKNREVRDDLIGYLRNQGIQAVFHYLPLHSSFYFRDKHDGRDLPNTDRFAGCIVRLPFFYSLKEKQIRYITGKIFDFFRNS
jgi:dTDP-4-amino-4,6-dideoxygalactose transaminase